MTGVRSDGLNFVKFQIDTLSDANMIWLLVDSHNKPILVIMEIPSKEDPAHDFVLLGVKYLFSAESMASSKH
ncbi:v-type proton atpase subunit f [Quercus suber]|uniref:V-type proton atpase subunit f n=1 Tax=Quercus suber TaxID=58331 RepID=A0AAW0KGL3_QUESU